MNILDYLKRVLSDLFTVETLKPVRTIDKSKFTEDQLSELRKLWEFWQQDKALFATQDAFAKEINTRFNTHRSVTTIIKYAKIK